MADLADYLGLLQNARLRASAWICGTAWPPAPITTSRLLLPDDAQPPARKYLDWHKTKVFVA